MLPPPSPEAKKKRKPKVEMEEFNFFDEKSKEKAPVIPKVPPVVVSEGKLQTDGSKQKLNIFRKISKIKEAEQAAAARSTTPVDSFERPMAPHPSTSSMDDTDSMRAGSPPRTPSTPRTPEVPSLLLTQKVKKERKLKIKKEKDADKSTMPRSVDDKFPSPLPPVEKISAREERLWAKEEAAMKESWPKEDKNKELVSTFDSMSPPKKKRGRPTKVSMTPEPAEPPKTPELPPPSPTIPPPVPTASNKPFFPFPNPFSVPGLIPPPLFQNVPFNLLGMAPGLRPQLGLPAIPNIPGLPGTSAPHPAMPNLPGPSPLFIQQAAKAEATKAQPPAASPTTKSPPKSSSGGIIDSLPDNVPPPTAYKPTEEEVAFNKKKEKREKKEKDKEKKKKDKKLKEKGGSLGGPDEEREKKMKKEKKKERKDKEKAIKAAAAAGAGVEKEEVSTPSVPKITFKFGAAPSSPRPATPETTPKL